MIFPLPFLPPDPPASSDPAVGIMPLVRFLLEAFPHLPVNYETFFHTAHRKSDRLSNTVVHSSLVQHWGTTMRSADYKNAVGLDRVALGRVTYYDGWPDEEPSEDLRKYWKHGEELPDTAVGFGAVRG